MPSTERNQRCFVFRFVSTLYIKVSESRYGSAKQKNWEQKSIDESNITVVHNNTFLEKENKQSNKV